VSFSKLGKDSKKGTTVVPRVLAINS